MLASVHASLQETNDDRLCLGGLAAWAVTRFGTKMDEFSFWLSDHEAGHYKPHAWTREADELVDTGLLFLQLYLYLACAALDAKRPRYKVRPKLHSFACEIIQRMYAGSRVNPRHLGCAGEEDFIGKTCGVIRAKVHAATFARRTLERSLLGINVHLMELLENSS